MILFQTLEPLGVFPRLKIEIENHVHVIDNGC